jgi:hypothetical protein
VGGRASGGLTQAPDPSVETTETTFQGTCSRISAGNGMGTALPGCAPGSPAPPVDSSGRWKVCTRGSGRTVPLLFPRPPARSTVTIMEPRSFGRVMLESLGLFETTHPIRPGVFVIGTGEAFKMKPVPEGHWPYVGIALDRPRVESGLMVQSDSFSMNEVPEGRIGEYACTDQTRDRLGSDLADRAFDMACVLQRLLSRFHANRVHPQTGLLGTDASSVRRVRWKERGQRYEAVDLPYGARKLATAHGCYSTHFRSHHNPLREKMRTGLAGALTLTGQIICIWAVLSDRFLQLHAECSDPRSMEALPILAGTSLTPLEWSDSDFRLLARAKAEVGLWASGEKRARRLLDDRKPERLTGGEAALRSGLSTEAIRRASKRQEWNVIKEGRENCYLKLDLTRNWPIKNFEPLDLPQQKMSRRRPTRAKRSRE